MDAPRDRLYKYPKGREVIKKMKKILAMGIIALLVCSVGLIVAAKKLSTVAYVEKGGSSSEPVLVVAESSKRITNDIPDSEEEKEEGYITEAVKTPTKAKVYKESDKESAELVAVLNVTSYVTHSGSCTIVSGRTEPYSLSAGETALIRVHFPIVFEDIPNVVWTNEIDPYEAKAHYAIDRSWIDTDSFDARITAIDDLSNNYIQYIAIGPV